MKVNDRQLKKAFKEFKTPASYDKKVDDVLEQLKAEAAKEANEKEPMKKSESKEGRSTRKGRMKWVFRAAVALLFIGILTSVIAVRSEANFLERFKRTLMDFFGMKYEDAADVGVKSRAKQVESKPDLMVELKEAVMDSHTIYLRVKITAPADIAFKKEIGFEYFGFCTGNNYDGNNLLGGSLDCRLMEVGGEKTNEAMYIVSIRFDEELKDGTPITCFLQNLAENPYSKEPKRLVEGMWSLAFSFEQTVVDALQINGGPEYKFSYIDGTAFVKNIELTPMGMVIQYDVSDVDYDLMNVSDTTIAVKLLYLDGHEQVIVSHNSGESFIQGGSTSYSNEGDKVFQQDNLEFAEILSIADVTGIYIEDVYISVR